MTSVAGGRITAGVGANLIGQHAQDRNQEATCYVGNLDEQVSEELLWELFTQAGPVGGPHAASIYVPKDRVTNRHRGHAFVEFKGVEDADYAIKVLNMIKMYGKPIRVNKSSQDKKATDIGANLFVGNLDPDVDEKMLYDTFSAFGVIVVTPKIMRDPDTGVSKGFGFVSFDSFEASDAAIEAMHSQYLMNRAISVQYAFKKDSSERHGTPAERLMAQQYKLAAMQSSRPHTMFATSAPSSGMNGAVPPTPSLPPAPPVPTAVPPAPPSASPMPPPPAPMQGHTMAMPPAAPPPWQGGGGGYMMARPPPPPWQMMPPQMQGYPQQQMSSAPPPPWLTGGMSMQPPSAMPPPPMPRPLAAPYNSAHPSSSPLPPPPAPAPAPGHPQAGQPPPPMTGLPVARPPPPGMMHAGMGMGTSTSPAPPPPPWPQEAA